VEEALRQIAWPEADAIWSVLKAGQPGLRDSGPPGQEVLRNARFLGAVRPARTIAELEYGVALPADWLSKVEPAQNARVQLLGMAAPVAQVSVNGYQVSGSNANSQSQIPNTSAERPPSNQYQVTDNSAARILRLSGNKDAAVSQWNAVAGTGLYRAAVAVRGKVSPGTIVTLVFAWLDRKEQHVGFKALRLPEGDWPEWVTLQQAGFPPAGAAWVGMGIRVQNQVGSDWIEAKGFSLQSSR